MYWHDKRPFAAYISCCVLSIAVTALTFQRCQDPDSDKPFTIDGCPAGQVINISSAKVGYNTIWDSDLASSSCSRWDVRCWTSTLQHTDIANCDGQRGCSISSNVLRNVLESCSVRLYPDSDRIKIENANFIRIEYQCNDGNDLLYNIHAHISVYSQN